MTLSRAEFTQWLTSRPSNCVGYPNNVNDCPLARFLFDRDGTSSIVYSTLYCGRDGIKQMPDWAERFTILLDTTYRNVEQPINGLQALTLLQEIPLDPEDVNNSGTCANFPP